MAATAKHPPSATASIQPVVPLQYIQSVRLVQALAETSLPIALPAEERRKFALLSKYMGARFHPLAPDSQPLHGLHIHHPTPETRIGRLSRTLIFPHAIVGRCRSFWKSRRAQRFTFAGLVTESRQEMLRTWIDGNLDLAGPWRPRENGPVRGVLDRLRRKLGLPPSGSTARIGALLLWSSSRGRAFPGKAWDEVYFKLLARSQFVLCPSGDFVWSYRFFEAVLCGAIPIVEESCPAYAGFQYHTFQDNARRLCWSAAIAEANFALARTRLTVPLAELEAEMKHLLGAAPAGPPEPLPPQAPAHP